MTVITMVKMIIYIDIMIMSVSNRELFIIYAFQGLVLLQWENLNREEPTIESKAAVDLLNFGTEVCAKWERWNPRNVDHSLFLCSLR